MMRPFAAVAVLATAVCLSGCARTGPPGGGPADSTPPVVEETTPSDGATLVDRNVEIRIAFSEEMKRVTVERAFSLAPRVELDNLKWSGRTLVAAPSSALPDSTTFLVTVGETAEDYHGVAIETTHVFSFSTGERLHAGRISGRVSMNGEPVAGAAVWACRGAVAPDADGRIVSCGYSTVSSEDGTFLIAGVRETSVPYTLLAFVDGDGDNAYSVGAETGRVSEAAAVVNEPGREATGMELVLEEPEEGAVDAPEEE